MPKEIYYSDSLESRPETEPSFNSEKVIKIEESGAARGGEFIELQDQNIIIKDLMIISQVLHDRLGKLKAKATSLQKERDGFDVSSLEYSKLNYDIKINDISIENTKLEISSNDDKMLELEDENKSLIAKN